MDLNDKGNTTEVDAAVAANRENAVLFANEVAIVDTANYFTATNVEDALVEIGSDTEAALVGLNSRSPLMQYATKINDFSDVMITSPVNGQSLIYDANLNQWVNSVPAGFGDSLLATITESTGYGIISGLTVLAQNTPNMTVKVGSGIAHMPNGTRYTPSAVPLISINPADAAKPRTDLIYLNSLGEVAYAPGTVGNAAIPYGISYTVTTNATAGAIFKLNLVAIKAVVSGASHDAFTFNIGATIAETVTNIKAFYDQHHAISNLFTITANGETLTLTERVPGGGAWASLSVYGAMTMITGTETVGKPAYAPIPTLPDGGLMLAIINVNPNTTSITNDRITNHKIDRTNVFNVLDYGAVGDGAHNDTDAFAAAADAINKSKGGVLFIPRGTYVVGEQLFAGQTGLGYAYKPLDIITLNYCTRPIIIEGNGSLLKIADNLKYGAFDPVSGLRYNPARMPFVSGDYRADVGVVIQSSNNKAIIIRDLEIDGNLFKLDLGGTWGDTGRQNNAIGINCNQTDNITIVNVNVHHHALDGIETRYANLTEGDGLRPVFMRNVTSEYNARGAFSWDSGNGLLALNCKFNHTGKAQFYSEPGGGVCLEIEDEESSIIRNGVFINCEMINNYNYGFFVTSGDMADIKCINCTIWGTTAYSLRIEQPRFTFEDCKIYGTTDEIYGDADPNRATKFYRCIFEDKEHPTYGYRAVGYNVIINGDNILFEDCTFIGNNGPAVLTEKSENKEIFRNCNFVIKNPRVQDGKYQVRFAGSYLKNCTFTEKLSAAPLYSLPRGWYVELDHVTFDNIYMNCQYTGWSNYTGVRQGNAGSNVISPKQYLALHINEQPTTVNGCQRFGNASMQPTTGDYHKGDVLFNNNPLPGQNEGWVCTTAGTQGTLNGGTTAGSVAAGSAAVTVNSLTGLAVGNYITIAGITGAKLIKKVPLSLASSTVSVAAASGQNQLTPVLAANYSAGDTVAVGRGTANYETAMIRSVRSGIITLETNLTKNHDIGEIVANCAVVDSNANATVANAAVAYSPATFAVWGIIGNSHVHIVSKTPAGPTDTGTTGEMCFDNTYIYICVATNTWKRITLASW